MAVARDGEPWTPKQLVLLVVVLVAGVVLVGLAAVGLGWIPQGAQLASPTPALTASPTSRSAPTTEPAAQAICETFEDLWDLQTDHAIPLAGRVQEWLSFGTESFDANATYADARAIGAGSVEAGNRIVSITYPADPALVVTLKQSIAGYAQGSVSMKKWLDAGDFQTRANYDMLEGMQLLASGSEALGQANLSVGIQHASGTLTCDARF